MAKRPPGPGRTRAVWLVGPIGPIMASVYWRPWGRSGKLKWVHRRGRRLVTGAEIQKEWEEMMARRPVESSLPRLCELSACGGSWEKMCPEVASWLCDGVYEDGQEKGEVSITFRRNGTTINAMLKIADGGLCLRANGDTPDDALVALELMLTATQVPWERDPWPLGRVSKGKKK